MQETQEMWVWPLDWEDLLEEGMAPHSIILAWKIPWTEEPSRLQSNRVQRAGHERATEHVFVVVQSCPTLCNTMDCNTPGFPDFCYLQEFAQIHVQWVGDAVQPSHPLSTQHACLMTLPVCRALTYSTVSSCSTHIVPQKCSIETGKIIMEK